MTLSNNTTIVATDGAKMQYLIKRRPGVSREELIANWFANHMPGVISMQQAQAAKGRRHARRYIATVYEPNHQGEQAWDGVAQLWWDAPLPRSDQPHGLDPGDTFQQKAEPYVAWPTIEYVVIDPGLPVAANTMNDPFPCTRSGFLKVTSILGTKPGVDFDRFFAFWLDSHAPNVLSAMEAVGGFGYVISQSIEPAVDTYAGMAELYFPDKEALKRYGQTYKPDGIEDFIDFGSSPLLWAHTEMVGIA